MKIKPDLLISNVEGMLRSKNRCTSYEEYPGAIPLAGRALASKLNILRRTVATLDDDYGMLKATKEVLESAKEECPSRKPLLDKVNDDLYDTKVKLSQYKDRIRRLKYTLDTVSCASSLLKQAFAYWDSFGVINVPCFLKCRDAWFRLAEDDSAYKELAKGSANLDATRNQDDRDTLAYWSYLAYTENVQVFNHPDNDDKHKCKIRGTAIVSFGTSRAGVPILLSLDCTFDLNGVIDGLRPNQYKYDIIAFRPAELITIVRAAPVRRSDLNKLEEKR